MSLSRSAHLDSCIKHTSSSCSPTTDIWTLKQSPQAVLSLNHITHCKKPQTSTCRDSLVFKHLRSWLTDHTQWWWWTQRDQHLGQCLGTLPLPPGFRTGFKHCPKSQLKVEKTFIASTFTNHTDWVTHKHTIPHTGCLLRWPPSQSLDTVCSVKSFQVKKQFCIFTQLGPHHLKSSYPWTITITPTETVTQHQQTLTHNLCPLYH